MRWPSSRWPALPPPRRAIFVEEARQGTAGIEGHENHVAAQAIKLLLLTGPRRNEVTQARPGVRGLAGFQIAPASAEAPKSDVRGRIGHSTNACERYRWNLYFFGAYNGFE